jgi:hypothetical protein
MGNWFVDISDWDKLYYDYSKNLICNFNIFVYDDTIKKFKFSEEEPLILKKLLDNPVNAHLHWLGVGTGIEMFVKSVLMKHKLLPLTNRKVTNKYPEQNVFYSTEEKEEYFSDDIAMVYRCCKWWKAISPNNEWIKEQLETQEIVYIFDLKTPTLGWLYKTGIKGLYNAQIINHEELTFIERALETFTQIRRNVDSHMFIGRTVGSIQKDREKVYLPLLNHLNEIYLR